MLIRALLMLLLVTSCAKRTKVLTPLEGKPNWMQSDALYNHKDPGGKFLIHPFFDLTPLPSKKDNSINFVMTTPVNSQNKYELDLRSGMLFRKHQFCKQEDVWKKYSDDLKSPPYSEGVVPRLLDSTGKAQKIIVFGKKRYFQPFQKRVTRSQRVRIVGGVLKQYCFKYPCRGANKWISKLLLVAVNPNDPRFTKVTHINQLKKKVDWEYVKAFLENADGRKVGDSSESPSYRIVGNIGPRESIVNAFSKGRLFKFTEMRTMRKSCHKLYDYLWHNVQTVRKKKITKKLGKKKEARTIWDKKEVFSGNVLKDERPEISKKKVKVSDVNTDDFSHFFKYFYNKYRKRYQTCQKFVRDTSINANPERMWLFSYLSSFLNTEKIGYIYSCSRRTWIENPMLISGKRMYPLGKHLNNCTTYELDRAFDMSVTVQTGLSRSLKEHYRYIEYDEGSGGSHQKIYSWIHSYGDTYKCDSARQASLSVFPRDIIWKNFGGKEMRKRTDIIE